jgi:hypothetical protein
VEAEEEGVEPDVCRAQLREDAALRAAELGVHARNDIGRPSVVEEGEAAEARGGGPLLEPARIELLRRSRYCRRPAQREGGLEEAPWAASFARASTASFPAMPTCAGTQCKRIRGGAGAD